MIYPDANINWITHFEIPEWNYNLECDPVKSAGGCKLEVEARVLLKILWPQSTQFSQLTSGSTSSMVKMGLFLAPLLAELLEP